ncbi:thiamine transport system ATP-binding protein [Volucribacter psittacicida]|uniref:Thiamine transport system ATP-binding protein n=1 Tax=Volucribacter psittacicida TaxID=203482 RepID=A0A4R1FUA7_9PAST|nr:thiamine ABC transporter ATP-binding protein [Volucribacter psittacicida]TCJ96098.1 thiamine transport system ATP-binding protein [Volucribacter psittacicida]
MIKLTQVEFHYQAMPMYFDLHIPAGQRVAIIGSSGAGKSTLLNLIAGFELAEKGEICLAGQNCNQIAPHLRPVSMLFQENNLFNHLTVWQNIGLGLQPHLKLNKNEQQEVAQALEAVGLTSFATRLPTQLSGGQKQRVALARCLLRNKPILLLDEPFSALDPLLRGEMAELLDKLCQEKALTMLIVTHQPNELAGKIDRIIRIEQGKVIN